MSEWWVSKSVCEVLFYSFSQTITVTSKYLARYAHEAFFRPTLRNHKYTTRSRAKKSKVKSTVLTDKERRAWAREHYEQYHDPSPINTTSYNHVNFN